MKGQGLVEYALILALVAVVVVIMIAAFFPIISQPDSLVRYDQYYAECMARETIGADYCHNIARVRTYGR